MDGSPSPSSLLVCIIHNRQRTRRNLVRTDGGWRCKPDEPCKEGKGASKGSSKGKIPAGSAAASGRAKPQAPSVTAGHRGRREASRSSRRGGTLGPMLRSRSRSRSHRRRQPRREKMSPPASCGAANFKGSGRAPADRGALAAEVKERQKASSEFNALWRKFCTERGETAFDPMRHSAQFLQDFIDFELTSGLLGSVPTSLDAGNRRGSDLDDDDDPLARELLDEEDEQSAPVETLRPRPTSALRLKSSTDMDKEGDYVLCALHNKMRHVDRMAKKGDKWVCMGDDKCRTGDEVQAPSAGSGKMRLQALVSKLRGLGAARKETERPRRRSGPVPTSRGAELRSRSRSSNRSLSLQGDELEPDAGGGEPEPWSTGSREDNLVKGAKSERQPEDDPLAFFDDPLGLEEADSLSEEPSRREGRERRVSGRRRSGGKGKGKSDNPPPGMVLCCAHSRFRFQERMQQRRNGEWICSDSNRCRNADEIRCSVHKRWRTLANMEKGRDNEWVCKAGCECR